MSHSVAIIGSRGFPSTYGGFETFIRRLAPYLRDTGVNVTVYCRDSYRRAHIDWYEGIRRIHTGGIDTKAASTLSFGLSSSLDARKRGFDAALVLNVANGPFLSLLHAGKIPCAVNVDGIEWERAKWGAVAQRMFEYGASRVARNAECIIVDSREIGRVWQSRFSVDTVFIPYGADVVNNLPSRRIERLGLKPNSYVLAVARLVPENNLELLLDAITIVALAIPVVIVGSSNYDNPITTRLTMLQAKRPDFHWLGHVDDEELLLELWAHAGVYFHGHSVGGTNPALLQALGCASPTVALDTPFNREVLGFHDQLVPPDPAAVAEKLKLLLSDERYRAQIASRGPVIIENSYRWPEVCAQYATELERLADGGPA